MRFSGTARKIAFCILVILCTQNTFYAQMNGANNSFTAMPPDNPLSPLEYSNLIKKGFDVGWSEFNNRNEAYSEALVKLMANSGFDHVRIRTGWDADSVLFKSLDRQIADCMKNGIVPIIAYQAHDLEQTPDSINQAAFVKWWSTIADHFKNYSHKLAFNLIIEISDELSNQPETLNTIYEKTVAAIRETNPTRIILISPVGTSDPNNLKLLKIPSKGNGYLMGEWHFYASGPSKTSASKLWTTGTAAEKKLVTDKINAALDWEIKTGVPTWVGAWMPGNYNKGDDYTVAEQVIFASFMVREFDKAKVPWSVNADNQFTDFLSGSNTWTQQRVPVKDVIVDSWKASLYTKELYAGASVRIAAGSYNKDYLEKNGLLNNIKSFMVPADFSLYLYSSPDYSGIERKYDLTDSSLILKGDKLNIESIKLVYNGGAVSVKDNTVSIVNAEDFSIYQNYPNPFNPETNIKFTLSKTSNVRLVVFDINGREIKELYSGERLKGTYNIGWDGTDKLKSKVAGGIYFVRITVDGVSKTIKTQLLK